MASGIQLQKLGVVANIDGGHAVDHHLIRATAADAGSACHAGSQRREACEVAAADRDLGELGRGHGVGPLAALRLEQGGLGDHVNRFADSANLEADRRNDHAFAAADAHAGATNGFETLDLRLDHVGVSGHVGYHELARLVGGDRAQEGVAAFARDGHDDAGDGRALSVGDSARDRSRRDLGGCGRHG